MSLRGLDSLDVGFFGRGTGRDLRRASDGTRIGARRIDRVSERDDRRAEEALAFAPHRQEDGGMASRSFTAILEREGDLYVALCPELDVASQGATVEEATANLKEAVELFLEMADPSEVAERLRGEVYVTRFEAAHG